MLYRKSCRSLSDGTPRAPVRTCVMVGVAGAQNRAEIIVNPRERKYGHLDQRFQFFLRNPFGFDKS